MSLRFRPTHRLKRRKLIRSLFDRKNKDIKSFGHGCVRIIYRIVPKSDLPTNEPLQVGFAPGRRIRTAVKRNRIKRLMREAFRVHQHRLVDLFVLDKNAVIFMALFRGQPNQINEVNTDFSGALLRLAENLSPDETTSEQSSLEESA